MVAANQIMQAQANTMAIRRLF